MPYPERVESEQVNLQSLVEIRRGGVEIYRNFIEIIPDTVGVDSSRGTGLDALFCLAHKVYLQSQGNFLKCPTSNCTTAFAPKALLS